MNVLQKHGQSSTEGGHRDAPSTSRLGARLATMFMVPPRAMSGFGPMAIVSSARQVVS